MTISVSTGAMLVGLGAFHGINPGMGWLFAVALGMQEGRRSAVWRAVVPLGLGHGLAVAAAMAVAAFAGAVLPMAKLRWPVGVCLIGFGIGRLMRHRHPRPVGMRVGLAGLTLWSFLMATAHGAGLMVVPAFLVMGTGAGQSACHPMSASAPAAILASLLHAAGYVAITAAVAWIVFEKVGVRILRKAWVNVDLIWTCALIATGVLTVLI